MSQKTIRLTMAQAVAKFLTMQKTVIDGDTVPIFGGVFAIFGHGNVAGVGEALYGIKDTLPTYRAQNEQGMANAAVAFAKASFRRRFMACTSSIGPGALNMVTAAAVAHVNRLPVLLLPGDVFANRLPDPVLQQAEDFGDGTITVNDCFKPVSRYFDRITRPEQIMPALRRAMQVLTDPAECGPVTLSLCQDVQAEAYDYPESFFDEKVWGVRRVMPDSDEFATASTNAELPSDAQVIGAVQRARENAVLVCAAGGLPGELHKLWKANGPGSYHMEYGFSTMGYEIAGGLGVKLARPDADVVVMVGDGSYMMLNSEIASSIMLGAKLTIVLLDNAGYGCINRLQMATGGANFNNLLRDTHHVTLPGIDFAAHAASMGAMSRKVGSIAELETALQETESNDRTTVIVIDTDPLITTDEGGHWWDVAVPEVSDRPQVNTAREAYVKALKAQRAG